MASNNPHQDSVRPNILFILVDNLGYAELSVYGGRATRGAPTPRLDRLASEGLRLTNMNMEPQCTPSCSSMLTGRYAIRSRTHSVAFGGVLDGLTKWEVTRVPWLFNLYVNPREELDKIAHDSWVVGPALKMVSEFEHSTKYHPLIPMGTPDPYTPRK
jgi:hypothetical protein